MKIRGLRYSFTEAFKNIFSNGWMTLASIFTVIASLLVLGVFLTLTINVNHMVNNIQDSYEVVVFVDEKVNDDGVEAIGEKIKKISNISEVKLTTSEERLENLKDKMGNDADKLDRYEDDNPLRDMYRVTLEDLSLSESTIEEIEEIDGIAKIQRNEEAVNKLVTIARYIQNFSLWIILALAIVSIFIISNTIKLTVYTRRKEINIMKFVGATDWFIRWPFIIEGIFIGILGAGISIGLILGGYVLLNSVLSSLEVAFISLLPLNDLAWIIVGSSLGLGAILGGIGSFISVRKHLNV